MVLLKCRNIATHTNQGTTSTFHYGSIKINKVSAWWSSQ